MVVLPKCGLQIFFLKHSELWDNQEKGYSNVPDNVVNSRLWYTFYARRVTVIRLILAVGIFYFLLFYR